MILCKAMAHICQGFLDKYPALKEQQRHLFETKKGRFGYYGSQLSQKHKLPKGLAVAMSSQLNHWLDVLEEAQLSEKERKRLEYCTFSYSSLAARVTACKTRFCPWCRAVQIMHVEGLLKRLQPTTAIVSDHPVVDSLPVVKSVPGACLVVRNVIVTPTAFVLRIASFLNAGVGSVSPGDVKKVARTILGFDYGLMNPEVKDRWCNLVKGLRVFSCPATRDVSTIVQ